MLAEDIELVLLDAPSRWWPFPSKPLQRDENGMFLVEPGKPFAVSMRRLGDEPHIDGNHGIEFPNDYGKHVKPRLTSGHNRWAIDLNVEPNTMLDVVFTVDGVSPHGHHITEKRGVIRVVGQHH